jgi:hypothetical protein
MIDNPQNLSIDDTIHDQWHERDRHNLVLYMKNEDGSFGDTIVEWWDEDYEEAVEDGFIDPRRPHETAFEYALNMGLLNPENRVFREPVPTGYVIVHDELGALMTWKSGGYFVWSSEADSTTMERGAVSFADEDAAREFFEEDVDGEEAIDNQEFLSKLSFHEVELDVVPEGHTRPRRVSATGLAAIGVASPIVSNGI